MRGRRRFGALVGALALATGGVAVQLAAPPAGAAAAPATWGWGAGNYGGFGAPLVDRSTPAALLDGWSFTALAAGAEQTLAIGADGELYGWGGNLFGEVGNATQTTVTAPVRVTLPGGVKPAKVFAGNGSSAAIGTDGSLAMWGSNFYGALGVGSTYDYQTVPIAVPLPGGVHARDAALAWGMTWVLGDDGHAYAAGMNDRYYLGDGTTVRRLTFTRVAVPGDAPLVAVGVGAALGADGTVYTWGDNTSGQMGTGSTAVWTDVRTAQLPAGVKARTVSANGQHTAVVGTDDRIYTWGSNTRGQLGDGTTSDRWSPVPIDLPNGVRPVAVQTGLAFTVALGADGRAYAWGINFYGNLGDGTTANHLTPVAVALPSDRAVVAYSVGQSHTIALVGAAGTTPPPVTPPPTTTPPPTEPPTVPPTAPPTAPPTTPPPPTEVGGSELRLHVLDPTQLVGNYHLLDAAVTPLPEGLVEVIIHTNQTDAETTGELRVGPCAAGQPTTDPDVVARTQLTGATALLVPAGSCAFTNTFMEFAVTLMATVSTDPADPAFVDVADTALPTLPVPVDPDTENPIVPPKHHLTTEPVVPANALYDVLIVRTSTPTSVMGQATPCTGISAFGPTIATGGGRAVVALVPHDACARLTPSGDGAGLDITVAGYLAAGAGTPTPTFPHWRSQGLVAPSFVASSPARLFDTRDDAPIAAGDARVLDLSGLEAAVSAVVLNVTVTEPAGPGYVTVYPCDAERPTASNLNMVAGQTVANQVTVGLLADRRLCFYSSVTTHLVADLSGTYVLGTGDGYEPAVPVRLFDTRDGGAVLDDGATYRLDLTDRVASSATAVSMNTTVTGGLSAGFVTVYPCDEERPLASSLNFSVGTTVANLVTVKVGASRSVCFFVHGRTHLLADLAGSYSPAVVRGFVDVVPDRVFDTRETGGPQPAGETGTVTWKGYVEAVALNVTATEPTAPGFVTVYPCAAGQPLASNVNYGVGQTVPNAVVAAVDANHQTCFSTHTTTHLVTDIAGYFSSAKDYVYRSYAVEPV